MLSEAPWASQCTEQQRSMQSTAYFSTLLTAILEEKVEQKEKVQQMSNKLARLRTLPNVILPQASRNFIWIHELSEDIGAPFPFKAGHHVT
eukprot:10544099-Karenia_brevis.AAC.1